MKTFQIPVGCQQENKEGGFRAALLQTPVIIVTLSSGTKMHVHNRVWLLLPHEPPSLTSVGQRWNKEVNNVSGPFGKKPSSPQNKVWGKQFHMSFGISTKWSDESHSPLFSWFCLHS